MHGIPVSLPICPIGEDALIRPLRENSDIFERFYNEEREKTGDISWFIDPNLPRGFNAATITNGIIRQIRISPTASKNAKTIAHEIMHMVRYDSGLPLNIEVYHPTHKALSSRLASMLEDPIVDDILQRKYGFDLLSGYKAQVGQFKEELREFKGEPICYLIRVRFILSFVETAFEWDLIKDERARNEFVDYQSDHRTVFPDISKKGDDLISVMQEIGSKTTEEHKKIFNYIVEKYGLQNVIYLW